MINTYQTSLAAPPVPPRLNRSHPVLMPGPLPSPGHSKSLIRFLVGVVLLHLVLSLGGFMYLYQYEKKEKLASAEGKAAYRSTEKQETSNKALARMRVTPVHEPTSGYLQWNIKHSDLTKINYYRDSWLTVQEPGDYFIYSRVTFSKSEAKRPLASMVKLRKNEKGPERIVMQAYCSLENCNEPESIPRLCTATQVEVITLEKGNQLSVWVHNLSMVDYSDGATAFGMYKM